jgi:hypothetical protein
VMVKQSAVVPCLEKIPTAADKRRARRETLLKTAQKK